MYEHPYFTEKVAEFENERLERAAERRRFLAEHADQIVPRAPGAVRRLGRRMLRAIARPRPNAPDAGADAVPVAVAPRVARVAARAAIPAITTGAPVDRCVAIGCDPVPAR